VAIDIPIEVARRLILGKQGLWPGRRWRAPRGTEQAMRAMEHLQLDPLVLVARAHDLMLHGRVLDYRPGDWEIPTYRKRRFFDWGGWLAVRPMEELPHWRVLMRRERDLPNWAAFQRDHGPVIDEMRAVLRERGTVSNRDFAAGERTRVDHYRGRKDSGLALHFLWRVGEAMVSRREGFERVYALTEAVAPPEFVRESDPTEADDFLLMKTVAAEQLSLMRTTVDTWLRRTLERGELAAWRAARIESGELVEVKVEGWKASHVALTTDLPLIETLLAGRTPRAWKPLEGSTLEEATFLAPLDPVSARGRSKALFGFAYIWEIYKPAELRRFGPYTMPILWGDRLVGRFDSRMDRPTSTLVVNGLWLEDEFSAPNPDLVEAVGRGMDRFLGLLGAERIDAGAVADRTFRARLAAASYR
jgi:uncharacterized protein YcaQ